jgi:hypothetical protein
MVEALLSNFCFGVCLRSESYFSAMPWITFAMSIHHKMFHSVLVWCWVPMGRLCLQEPGYMHYWVALLIHSVFLTVLVGIESVKQKIKNHNL